MVNTGKPMSKFKMSNHEKLNYVEYPACDLTATKSFFTNVFNWQFTDYGPEYTAFNGSGLDGGFYKTDQPVVNGALVVLYHNNLEDIQNAVVKHGGVIAKDIFSFPGGRRFHFTDPIGNELAIWSDK